jgi:ribosomal protein S12 methylthiotransferase
LYFSLSNVQVVAGEVLLGDMHNAGFEVTDDHEQADAVIVNTCAFIEDAQSESLDAILQAAQLRAENENKKLIVTGCMAQRYANDLATQLPEIDAVVGFEKYGQLPDRVHKLLNPEFQPSETAVKVMVGTASPPFRPEVNRVRLTQPHTAYIRVAEGCDHACTFCAIPGAILHSSTLPFAVVL